MPIITSTPPYPLAQPPAPLKPGVEVDITKTDDPNDGRTGHIRKAVDQHAKEYQVVFEPGEQDYRFERGDLRPTGRVADPDKLPPEAKEVKK